MSYKYLKRTQKITSLWICCCFLLCSTGFVTPVAAGPILSLTPPGEMVFASQSFDPVVLSGIKVNPNNPFQFDFIVDHGSQPIDEEYLGAQTQNLIHYFLAALAVSDDEMWVNLSPNEKNRIIAPHFGQTIMGRDLLAQDYLLKQITSSLTNPNESIGKAFWDKIHKHTYEKLHTTEIPLNSFNKIWIVPESADVYEIDHGAVIGQTRLKVMMDKDYKAMANQRAIAESRAPARDTTSEKQTQKERFTVHSSVFTKIILPEIEREVNEGEHFAPLRQIYHSMILASWFKQRMKKSILHHVYAERNKLAGIDVEDKDINHKIYDQYVEAYQQGVFNFIKEEYDSSTQTVIPRKYFSGGANFGANTNRAVRFHPGSQIPSGFFNQTKSYISAVLKPYQRAARKGRKILSWVLMAMALATPQLATASDSNEGILKTPAKVAQAPDIVLRIIYNENELITIASRPDYKKILAQTKKFKNWNTDHFEEILNGLQSWLGENYMKNLFLNNFNEFEKLMQFVSTAGIENFIDFTSHFTQKDILNLIDQPILNAKQLADVINAMYTASQNELKTNPLLTLKKIFTNEELLRILKKDESTLFFFVLRQIEFSEVIEEIVTQYPFLFDFEGNTQGNHLDKTRDLLKDLPDMRDVDDKRKKFRTKEALKAFYLYFYAKLAYYQNIAPQERDTYGEALRIITLYAEIDEQYDNANANSFKFSGKFTRTRKDIFHNIIAHESAHRFFTIGLGGNTSLIIHEMAGDIGGFFSTSELFDEKSVRRAKRRLGYQKLGRGKTHQKRTIGPRGLKKERKEQHYYARLQLKWIDEEFGPNIDRLAMFKAFGEIDTEYDNETLPEKVLFEIEPTKDLKKAEQINEVTDPNIIINIDGSVSEFTRYLLFKYFKIKGNIQTKEQEDTFLRAPLKTKTFKIREENFRTTLHLLASDDIKYLIELAEGFHQENQSSEKFTFSNELSFEKNINAFIAQLALDKQMEAQWQKQFSNIIPMIIHVHGQKKVNLNALQKAMETIVNNEAKKNPQALEISSLIQNIIEQYINDVSEDNAQMSKGGIDLNKNFMTLRLKQHASVNTEITRQELKQLKFDGLTSSIVNIQPFQASLILK